MKDQFARELAGVFIASVRDLDYPERVSRISSLGHFQKKLFYTEEFIETKFKTFARVLVNLALDMPSDEFMELWLDVGMRVTQTAEELSNTFNDDYSRKDQDL
jgi:hypothetical protein